MVLEGTLCPTKGEGLAPIQLQTLLSKTVTYMQDILQDLVVA